MCPKRELLGLLVVVKFGLVNLEEERMEPRVAAVQSREQGTVDLSRSACLRVE